VVKQYVLGLEVVLASGKIVNLGGVTSKNRAGYELVMLFTGSEGTLGVITKIILKLLPMPPAHKSILAIFDDMAIAGQAVSNILSSGVIPAKIEFVDNWLLRRVEELTPMGLPIEADAMLLMQIDGTPEAIEIDAKHIMDILTQSCAKEARLAKDDAEASMFWTARSNAAASVSTASHTILAEDVTVPRDKIAHYVRRVREISKKYSVTIVLLGHAGDGNIHPNILTDERDVEHFKIARKAVDEIVETALASGGVLSGEHGIGLSKRHYLKKAVDPVAIELMKKIKDILDPNNILNPDKIWES